MGSGFRGGERETGRIAVFYERRFRPPLLSYIDRRRENLTEKKNWAKKKAFFLLAFWRTRKRDEGERRFRVEFCRGGARVFPDERKNRKKTKESAFF